MLRLDSSQVKTRSFIQNFQQIYGVSATGSGGRYLPYGIAGDIYDLFPQFLLYNAKKSGNLMQSIKRKAKFVYGAGFMSDFKNFVVNLDGQKANDLLLKTCLDIVAFENCAWHVNYNALGQICEIRKLPFEKIRAGEPDDNGNVNYYCILHKWDKYYTKRGNQSIEYYHAFNPNPEIVRAQIASSGGVKMGDKGLSMAYKGQILYFENGDLFGEYYTYPTYAPVLQDAENESNIAISKRDDIGDRFKPTVIITKFGTNEPTFEQRERDVSAYSGTVGIDGSRFVLEYAINPESAPAVNSIQQQDLSRSYEYAEKSIKTNIQSMFGIPQELFSFSDKTDFLGDSEKIQKLLDLFQKTELLPIQQRISDIFQSVFAHWRTPILEKEFKIQNLSII